MTHSIEVENGTAVKLPTAGKYCDRDILVTATGGGGYTEADLQTKYNEGAQAEYDRFWDSFQQNGSRTGYGYAFGGWTAEAFKPKYSMSPTNCTYMFAKMVDTMSLTEALEQAGVVLDTSLSNNHTGMFFESTRITEIPHIDLSKSAYATNLFNYCLSLREVEITVAANTVPNYSGWFTRCDVLEDLKVNGVIDKSGLTLQQSPKLSADSIANVVNALSSTTSGLSVTFSKTAVDNVFTME